VLVGRSRRTNADGIRQLGALLAPLGYEVTPVDLRGCLHLKSAVTQVAAGLVLANPEWLGREALDGLEVLAIDPAEPAAANALLVAGRVVLPRAHPLTRRRLENAGLAVETLELSELQKAEGGVTCCSLLFEA
jgi:dimethylargininase